MERTWIIAHLYLLGCILHSLNEADAASEFELDGDYLIGGLFDIHHVSKGLHRDKPETITCSRWDFYSLFMPFLFSRRNLAKVTSIVQHIWNILSYNCPFHANVRFSQDFCYIMWCSTKSLKANFTVGIGKAVTCLQLFTCRGELTTSLQGSRKVVKAESDGDHFNSKTAILSPISKLLQQLIKRLFIKPSLNTINLLLHWL